MLIGIAMRAAHVLLGALLAMLLAGCSSESVVVPPPDLAARPTTCMLVLSGDLSNTVACDVRFCRGATGDGLTFQGPLPIDPLVNFGVDGPFTVGRSYTIADLTTFYAVAGNGFASSVSYVAGSQFAGSTVTLTIDDIELNNNLGCASGNGTAHGSAHIGLVEAPGDGGTTGTGHATIDATF